MYSFRRFALLPALILLAVSVVNAENLSSSSDALAAAQDQTPPPATTQSQQQQQLSVQARIRARRDQRRTAAMHQVYDHLYDVNVGGGYLRFLPGKNMQRVNVYDWNAGLTRYYSDRLGVTVDGRGYYGTPFIPPLQTGGTALNKPAISLYMGMIGPTYRVYMQPKYSIAARVMGGYARGNFSGDTNGFAPVLPLYPDGGTFAINAAALLEYHVTPNVGVRVAPEYMATGFGSTMQNSLGFTAGIVVRFGKR